MRVGVIACSKTKRAYKTEARDLYQGTLFRRAREIVEFSCARWCILSAEHGMLLPTRRIAPYEKTLRSMSADDRWAWSEKANQDLVKTFGRDAVFVVYAGKLYRSALAGLQYSVPLEGLGLGLQVQALNRILDQRAREIAEEKRERSAAIARQLAMECIEQWHCDHCGRQQYGQKLIYSVRLCLRCIGEVAADRKYGHYEACRSFLLERENARLQRLLEGLHGQNEALV